MKPGDKIAFYNSHAIGCKWHIATVDKVTASGRIVCGHTTLNPDLTVRGNREYWQPSKGVPVTQEIVDEIKRYNAATKLKSLVDWHSLPLSKLKEVLEVLEK